MRKYKNMLDIMNDSDLRNEITSRTEQGESCLSIENDLVKRGIFPDGHNNWYVIARLISDFRCEQTDGN